MGISIPNIQAGGGGEIYRETWVCQRVSSIHPSPLLIKG